MTALIAPYQDFIQSKQLYAEPSGIDVAPDTLHSSLKPHQRYSTVWTLKQGRAAVFFERGLGKTRVGIEFGRALINHHIETLKGFRVLIICPLAVVDEFLEEGREINYLPKYAPDQSVIKRPRGIWLTNFERADRFDASLFDAVIIDEASCLKSLDSKTRIGLTKQWRKTKFKLLLTATPSPNDVKELVNYSEFLGIMSRKEVFATFFINETGKGKGGKSKLVTRLKHNAVEPFYRWLSSWAIAARKPSDLGFDDTGYDLPPLNIVEHEIESGWVNKGQLVYTKLSGVQERASLYKATQEQRVQKALELVQHNEQVILWHLHNHEGYLLRDALPDSVLVEGAMSAETKAEAFKRFKRGEVRVLITKSSIGGFGVNFQNSYRHVWVGINDSFESWYQAVGRQHRFGQEHPVQGDVILADAQRPVWDNVLRKKIDHENMIAQLVAHMGGTAQLNRQRHEDYQTDYAAGENWKLYQGDSCDPFGAMSQIEDNSVGISVHSPPFLARYAYTATERDLGNSRDKDEFMQHYRYQIRELLRVTMPGRSACVHVQNIRTTKRDTDTHPGLIDFRGEVIRAFEAEGWVWVHEVTVDKSAQQQAKRKHHQGLLYKTKNTDSSKLAGALADYLLVFRKPGDNPEPIWCDVPDEVWNWWARPVWYDIDEIDVLDTQVAASDDDEMHLCPLQKPFIERCIRLWSNKGDLVLDPFNGISSTGWVAIEHGRRYVGIELKPNYFQTGVKNLIEIERKMRQVDLFKWSGQQVEVKPVMTLPHFDLKNNPLLDYTQKEDSPVSESVELEIAQ